jgi:hypothetical protein
VGVDAMALKRAMAGSIASSVQVRGFRLPANFVYPEYQEIEIKTCTNTMS